MLLSFLHMISIGISFEGDFGFASHDERDIPLLSSIDRSQMELSGRLILGNRMTSHYAIYSSPGLDFWAQKSDAYRCNVDVVGVL